MKHIYIYIIGSADFGVVEGGGYTNLFLYFKTEIVGMDCERRSSSMMNLDICCGWMLYEWDYGKWEWTVRGDPAVG